MVDRLFDLNELLYSFKKRFWIIIVVTAILTSLAVYKVSKYQPSYMATKRIFMGDSDNMLRLYSEEELTSLSEFLSVYKEVSTLDGFLDEVLKKNKIEKTSLEVASAIQFSNSGSLPVVNITYSSYTDHQMKETLDVMAEELIKQYKILNPSINPKVLSEANVITIYPDKKKLPTIAMVGGIMLSIGIILGLDAIDTKILSKKQLEKVIPVPVLGNIPTLEKEFKKEIKNVCSKQDANIPVSRSI